MFNYNYNSNKIKLLLPKSFVCFPITNFSNNALMM